MAWLAREHAFLIGTTKVGAVAVASDGTPFAGCNVEHRFRCHDVHAEVNAITSLIASGRRELKAVIVVAERDRFTPCGGCMDWIFQFGGGECLVAYQRSREGEIIIHTASELMPHYPQ
jgi:cytidine deaminase